MIIVSRDEEELEKSSFERTSCTLIPGSKEKSLETRLAYQLLTDVNTTISGFDKWVGEANQSFSVVLTH